MGWDPVRCGYPREPRLEFVLAERYPLGTRYVDIAENLAFRVRQAENQGFGVKCAVDATGVGDGVIEILQEAGLHGRVWPVVLTGGSGDTGHLPGKSRHSLTKTQLFYRLRVAMETGRTVLVHNMKGRELLLDELRSVEERRTRLGYLTVSGKANGGYDDLAFAAALAQWALQQSYPGDIKKK